MPVTIAIIVICCIVFIVSLLLEGPAKRTYSMYALSLHTYNWHMYSTFFMSFITSMFMHGSAMHIMCNMVSLYYLGSMLERLFGSVRFAILYFASGLAGGVATILYQFFTGNISWTVGASGAIFGLFGAYGILLFIEYRKPVVLSRESATRSLSSFGGLLAVNIAISFMPGIAGAAHFGGLFMGCIIGAIYCCILRKKARSLMENHNQNDPMYWRG